MKTKRYVAPTGIHGLRRRVVRWLFNRFSTPVLPSTHVLPTRGIDRILICRTSHSLANTLLLTPLLAELERVYPGLAIAHGRYKLGFCGPEKNGQVTHAVTIPEHVHHVAKLPVYLLREALQRGDNSDAGYPVPDIRLSRIERAAGNNALARIMSGAHATCRPVVGVFANATGAKRLEGHWWKAMLNRLEMLLPGYAFIEFTPVLGASMLDLRYPTQYCSDLRKLTSVISQLAAFISVDGGLMHVAWASGATTLGLFTSTDVETWGPYGSNVTVINARNFSPEAIASIAAKRILKAVVRVDPTLSTMTLV